MLVYTAQPLVSTLFETQGIPTLSWSLTAHPSPLYIQTNVCPTADQIADVQSCADCFASVLISQISPTGMTNLGYSKSRDYLSTVWLTKGYRQNSISWYSIQPSTCPSIESTILQFVCTSTANFCIVLFLLAQAYPFDLYV